MKIDDIFLIFTPNTDCGCMLELRVLLLFSARIRKIKYIPINPTFPDIKGFCRVFIRQTY